MDYKTVMELLEIVKRLDHRDVDLEVGDFKIRLRRHGSDAADWPEGIPSKQGSVAPDRVVSKREEDRLAIESGDEGLRSTHVPNETGSDGRQESLGELYAVTAPMVGTFYRAPSPEAPPFVDVGDQVLATDTVGIIEVMKLMNSIQAGVDGTVVRVAAENAALVGFGQVLLEIEPADVSMTGPRVDHVAE